MKKFKKKKPTPNHSEARKANHLPFSPSFGHRSHGERGSPHLPFFSSGALSLVLSLDEQRKNKKIPKRSKRSRKAVAGSPGRGTKRLPSPHPLATGALAKVAPPFSPSSLQG